VQLQTSAKDQLRAIVTRIERLEEEKAALAADLREVYAEAKGNGFDTKVLRKIISLRKRDYAERGVRVVPPATARWTPKRSSQRNSPSITGTRQ